MGEKINSNLIEHGAIQNHPTIATYYRVIIGYFYLTLSFNNCYYQFDAKQYDPND